tara:strand:+ start:1379 stop:1588 length:210 start_codon:yes stop_codon:yes gene_type:complete
MYGIKKKVVIKNKKPLYKPKKQLSLLQKRLMTSHKEHHTEEHLKMMKKLMLDGYCFQQAHDITIKKIGK